MKYQINNIYNEDCYKAIKEIPSNTFDLIIMDPPYKMETRGGGFRNKRDYYDTIQEKGLGNGINETLLSEIERVMKKINIYIFCNKNQIGMYMNYFKKYNLDLLVWYKKNPIPVVNNKYLSDLEYIIFVREKGVKLYGDYFSLSKVYESNTNRTDKKLFNHPTIKPLELIKRLIENSSNEDDLICDFFLGSGTTAVASKELKRKYIGFELDKKYYKIAKDRLNGITANGQMSIFTEISPSKLALSV